MITESGTQIAVVANQIIRARHRLDPRQQKTIAWAIAQIPKDATTLDRQTLSIADFARLTDNDSGDIYRQMETVTTSLLRSILEIREPGGRSYTRFQWLSECEYRKGEGTVLLRLHPKLEPYLLELRGRFTRLALEKFFKFRSSYTIRLFERIEMQGIGSATGHTQRAKAVLPDMDNDPAGNPRMARAGSHHLSEVRTITGKRPRYSAA